MKKTIITLIVLAVAVFFYWQFFASSFAPQTSGAKSAEKSQKK